MAKPEFKTQTLDEGHKIIECEMLYSKDLNDSFWVATTVID
jgi:hypothetical protein